MRKMGRLRSKKKAEIIVAHRVNASAVVKKFQKSMSVRFMGTCLRPRAFKCGALLIKAFELELDVSLEVQ